MAVEASEVQHHFVVLTCYVEPDEEVGGFVSRCPALEVASQGETVAEAERNIREAVSLYLDAVQEDGDLEAILHACGVKLALDRVPRTSIRAHTSDGGLEVIASFVLR